MGHVGAADVGADEDDFMFVKRKVMESDARKPKVEKVKKVKRKDREEPKEKVFNPLLEVEKEKERQPAISQQQVAAPQVATAAPAPPPVKRKPKVVKF